VGFEGTTAKNQEEVIATRRNELQDNPGLAQKKIEDYSQWYREERIPIWQERVFNKPKGTTNNEKERGQTGVEENGTCGGTRRRLSVRSKQRHTASDTTLGVYTRSAITAWHYQLS
jgi:hypothetical protein